MRRCLNDYFFYCTGEPDAHVETTKIQYHDLGGKPCSQMTLVTMCRKDPKTCKFRTTQTQLSGKLAH